MEAKSTSWKSNRRGQIDACVDLTSTSRMHGPSVGPTLQGSKALIHRDSYFLTSKKLEGKMQYNTKMQRSGTNEFLNVLEDKNENLIDRQKSNFGAIFSASNSVMNEDLQRQIQNYQKSNLKTVCDDDERLVHGADIYFF